MSTRKDNSNKAALAVYIFLYIEEQAHGQLQENGYIVPAGGYEAGNLFCSHEEADNRMILHAIELLPNFTQIVVRSDDNEVLIILLHYCSIGKLHGNVFMHSGNIGRYCNLQLFVPVSQIAQHLTKGCQATFLMCSLLHRIMFSYCMVAKELLHLR